MVRFYIKPNEKYNRILNTWNLNNITKKQFKNIT